MPKQDRRLTIHDVARAAGVSVSTVSRVLNDKDDVAEATKRRVQQVVAQMGYASNLAARSMRRRKTNLLGVVVPDIGQSYSLEILKGCSRAIQRESFDLLIYTSGDVREVASAAQEQHYVNLLYGGLTGGVLVIAPRAASFNVAANVVIVDPNTMNPDNPAVIGTNHEGAVSVMRYLLQLGHRRIGFIGGRPELISATRRQQGYEDSLVAAGIPLDPDLIASGDYTMETGRQRTHQLLSLPQPPSAIFAANDQAAFGVLSAARERGLSVPDDLSVAGFDNIPESQVSSPPLTTVDQSLADMGDAAIQMLIKLVRGETVDKLVHKIATRLIVRDSCRPV